VRFNGAIKLGLANPFDQIYNRIIAITKRLCVCHRCRSPADSDDEHLAFAWSALSNGATLAGPAGSLISATRIRSRLVDANTLNGGGTAGGSFHLGLILIDKLMVVRQQTRD
jgi:hypothetical protein